MYTSIHILQVSLPEGKFPIQDILSLHSVHTQYEEMSAIDSPDSLAVNQRDIYVLESGEIYTVQ